MATRLTDIPLKVTDIPLVSPDDETITDVSYNDQVRYERRVLGRVLLFVL